MSTVSHSIVWGMNQEVRDLRPGRNVPTLTAEVAPAPHPLLCSLVVGPACSILYHRWSGSPGRAEVAPPWLSKQPSHTWLSLSPGHAIGTIWATITQHGCQSGLHPSSGTIWKSEMAFTEHTPWNAMVHSQSRSNRIRESPVTKTSQLKTR